jgi:dephospho-CoA kinase
MTVNNDKTPGAAGTSAGHPVTLSPCHLVTLSSSENGKDKLVVGLLGGIGSGKSQVAAAFAARGARVIGADELAHAALRQPEVRRKVAQRWGEELLDEQGEIQRRRLGAIVFADPAERRTLEAMVHPWIRERLQAEVQKARAEEGVRLIVLDAAIMVEAGWSALCDRLVYVDAPHELRLARVAQQRGWTEEEMLARESAQLPLTEKRVRADHVLDNSASPAHLQRQVDDLLQLWGVGGASTPAGLKRSTAVDTPLPVRTVPHER